MSILIKGIEMPKSCPCELIGIGYDLQCSFVWGVPARVKEYYECCQNNTRPSWCPLVPVPPHGRCIDADAFLQEFTPTKDDEDTGAKLLLAIFCQIVKDAPTILEAEGIADEQN